MRTPFWWLGLAMCGVLLGYVPVGAQGNIPRIDALEPSQALVGSGSLDLTVKGANFRDNAVVRWKGQERPTTFMGDGELRVRIPASDLAQDGEAEISVLVLLGRGGQTRVSNPVVFLVTQPPVTDPTYPRAVIQSLSPSSAPAGAEDLVLTVIGSHFRPGAKIHWNGSPRSTTGTAERLTTTLSAADLAMPGTARVTVVNAAPGSDEAEPRSFTVVHQPPRILGLSPERVTKNSGTFTLRVTGEHFIPSTSMVFWNGTPRTTEFVSSRQLEAAIPAADVAQEGTVTVTVRTTADNRSQTSPAVSYTVAEDPQASTEDSQTPTEDPQTPQLAIPMLKYVAPVTISSFSIRGGLPYVSVGRELPLSVSASGNPAVYRIARLERGCDRDVRSASWQPYSAANPPTWTFDRVGAYRLCLQLGRQDNDSTVRSEITRAGIEVIEPLHITASAGTTSSFGLTPDSVNEFRKDFVWPFAVAVNLRVGDFVDAAGDRSTMLGANGEHGALDGDHMVGGWGGTETLKKCSNGQVITHVRGKYGEFIDSIEFGCSRYSQGRGAHGSVTWLGSVGGPGGDKQFSLSCPTPLAAHRVQFSSADAFRYLQFVGGVRLVCLAPHGM